MKYGIYNLKTGKFEKNPFDKSRNNVLVFEYPIQAMKFIQKYLNSKDFTIQKLK